MFPFLTAAVFAPIAAGIPAVAGKLILLAIIGVVTIVVLDVVFPSKK